MSPDDRDILHALRDLAQTFMGLRQDVQALRLDLRDLATQTDLHRTENKIMSAISDFAAKQKAFNDRQSAAVDGAVESITGLTGDIQTLNDKITELQNSVGTVTPEDQALIDDMEAQGAALADKAEALATALKALDELNPPTPPPTP